jgi:peptidoglycan/xylan/chitin deacetylase (PgdA/CDA1 family)
MKYFKTGLLIIVFVLAGTISLSAQSASITTWKNDAQAAYSIVHDDYGLAGADGIWQYADSIAFNRGIQFVFGAYTGLCETRTIKPNDYSNLYDFAKQVMMEAHGHEIATHSYFHTSAVKLEWTPPGSGWGQEPLGEDMDVEINQAHQSIIDGTGFVPQYYVYPYDQFTSASNQRLEDLGYIGSRTGWVSPSDPWGTKWDRDAYEGSDPSNFRPTDNGFFRNGVEVFNEADGNLNWEAQLVELNNEIDNIISTGMYGNREFHNVGDSGWGHVKVEAYRGHMDYLKSKVESGDLWVGTVSEILTYQMQKLKFVPNASFDEDAKIISVSWSKVDSFDVGTYLDPLIIKSPVTLKVDVALIEDLSDLVVLQDGVELSFSLDGEIALVDVYPHKGSLIISEEYEPCPGVCIRSDLKSTPTDLVEGGDARLSIVAASDVTLDLTYSWFKDGESFVHTGSSYSINAVSLDDAGEYYVIVANGLTTVTSSVLTLSVLDQGPYQGIRHQLPGKIEAYKYDVGGQGVAFNDKEETNKGGVFVRSGDGVDVEGISDPASNYAVAWNDTNDWYEYSVDVEESGMYDMTLRVTSGDDGGAFILQDGNGQNLSTETEVPKTWGWSNWQNLTTEEFYLEKGPQVIRFYVSNQYFNFCAMTFTLKEIILSIDEPLSDAGVAVSLFPNPVNDVVTINSDHKILSWALFSNSGLLLDEGTGNVLAMGNLSSGLFYVQVQTENGKVVTSKITKQ